jgi:diguanylate cyclase (GGDEF)-like protein
MLVIRCADRSTHVIDESLAQDDLAIVYADGAGEGLELAARGEFDLFAIVAADLEAEVCALVRRLRNERHSADTPSLVLLDRAASDRVVKALEAGASDCLSAAIDPGELHARVRATIRAHRRHADALERAGLDPLTQLGNTRQLHRRIEDEVGVWDRHGRDVSLVLVDLDGFATLEAECGATFAEGVVSRVCEAVFRRGRSTDVFFHCGAGRFAALLRETPCTGALVFAERLRAAIEALPVPRGSRETKLTASIGVSSTSAWRMSSSDPRERLLGDATAAALRSRHAGGNRTDCEPRLELTRLAAVD